MEPEISTPAATAPQQQHDAPPVAKFMRKRSSKTAAAVARKRVRDDDDNDNADAGGGGGSGGDGGGSSKERAATADDDNTVVTKKRDVRSGPLAASSKPARDADSAAPSAGGGGAGDAPQPFSFAASGTAESLRQDFATRTLDVDGHERKEKVLAGDDAEGLYKGLGGYNEYVNKRVEKTTQSNAGGLRAGPLKAATNVRISSRFDYQPHVCKDYKETGSCGYGDSCIYMHDRGDYKMGWQLDLEWEEEQKRKQKEEEMRRFNQGQEAEEDEIEEDDDLPMSCMVCGNDFKDPVATKCQHYFCENCAIRTHTKTGKCFACSAPTNGVFNAAKDFKAKLLAKKKKMEERAEEVRRKAAAAGVEDEQ